MDADRGHGNTFAGFLSKVAGHAVATGVSEDEFVSQFRESSREGARRAYRSALARSIKRARAH